MIYDWEELAKCKAQASTGLHPKGSWVSIPADIQYNFRAPCNGSKWEIAQGMFLVAHKIILTFH